MKNSSVVSVRFDFIHHINDVAFIDHRLDFYTLLAESARIHGYKEKATEKC